MLWQVVVHNLPWSCTWQNLKDAFAANTQNIERADVIADTSGRSRYSHTCAQQIKVSILLGDRYAVHGPWMHAGRRFFSNARLLHACRGFGTVRYSSSEDAQGAAQIMNGAEIGGRTVTVRIDRFA